MKPSPTLAVPKHKKSGSGRDKTYGAIARDLIGFQYHWPIFHLKKEIFKQKYLKRSKNALQSIHLLEILLRYLVCLHPYETG
jgi:hypothetical protein